MVKTLARQLPPPPPPKDGLTSVQLSKRHKPSMSIFTTTKLSASQLNTPGSDNDSSTDEDGLDEHTRAARRLEKKRKRKARNQRRYYKRCVESGYSIVIFTDICCLTPDIRRSNGQKGARGQQGM